MRAPRFAPCTKTLFGAPSLSSAKMGSIGRIRTALFAFYALAILVAALARGPVPGSPVSVDREVALVTAAAPSAALWIVDSR